MDKQTLSSYGWIVICVLVLVVMIAFATPFAKYVFNGSDMAVTGLYDTEHHALNAAGIDMKAIYIKTEAELVAAVTKGQRNLILGGDITIHDTLNITYDMTIDMNGHAIHQNEPNKGIFEIDSGITLEIIDKYAEAYRHTYKQVDNHYVLDDNGPIAIYAGTLSGCHGNTPAVLIRGTFIANGITIAGNHHTDNGGVFAIMGGGKAILNGTTIRNNVSDKDGGIAKLSANAFVEMNGGFFTTNTANNGSAFYLSGGVFSMNGGRIEGNIARNSGGIYLESGTIMQNAGSIGDGIINAQN
jgi:hypothetical protein